MRIQIAFVCLFSYFALFNFQSVPEVRQLVENEILTTKSNGSQEFINFEITYIKDSNKSDLVVEAKALNQVNAPLVMISTQPIQNLTNSSKQFWVCNQISNEICAIPTKSFEDGQKVYISIGCPNCEFSLKYYLESIRKLELGKTETIHLRAGDSKLFEISLNQSESPQTLFINSFNLKLSNYKMVVTSLSSTLTELKEETVVADWKNGKQATINVQPLEIISTKILIEATEDGVFIIEALLDNTVVELEEAVTRLDIVSPNSKDCYHFVSAQSVTQSYLDIKNIEGKIIVDAKENDSTAESITKSLQEGNSFLIALKGKSFSICVSSEVQSAFTIQAYSKGNENHAKAYNNSLLGKLYFL